MNEKTILRKKRIIKTIITIIIITIILLQGGCQEKNHEENKSNNTIEILNTIIIEKQPISPEEQAALYAAINNEIELKNRYENIIRDFTEIMPFPILLMIEKQEIEDLKILFERYELKKPEEKPERIIYNDIIKACEEMRRKTRKKTQLYGELINMTDNEDIKNTFTRIMNESKEKQEELLKKCPQ